MNMLLFLTVLVISFVIVRIGAIAFQLLAQALASDP